MRKNYIKALALAMVISCMVFAAACASSAPTATPMAPATPKAPVAPTAVATPTAVSNTTQPSSTVALPTPTPTRVLPTATSISENPQYGGVLLKNEEGDIIGGYTTLLPGWGPSYESREVFNAVYDTLLTQDAQLVLKPELATSWDIASDGMSITFHLRKGVKFTNGQEFTAEVAKWNLDMNLFPDQAPKIDPNFSGLSYYFDLRPVVDSVQALDDYTLKINLKKSYRPFMAWLTAREAFSMLSPDAAAKYGDKLAFTPVGTGPFQFSSYVPSEQLKVVRNENYWDSGKPYLSGITWVLVPEETTRLAMLRTGELNMLTDISPDKVPVLNNNSAVKVIPYDSKTVTGLQFRTDLAPWTNKALRQAVAYAVNRQDAIDVLWNGQGQPAYNLETSGLWWSAPDIKPYTFDIQKAKDKLVEAGYPNGVTVKMGCQADTTANLQCAFFQAELKKAGINVDIIQSKQLTLDLKAGVFGFRIAYNWAVYYGDPDTRLRWVFYSTGPFAYLTHYNNPQVDQLLDQAVQIYDQQKAAPLYRQIIQLTTGDASWVTVIALRQFDGMQTNVQGFQWYPDDYTRVRDLWLSK